MSKAVRKIGEWIRITPMSKKIYKTELIEFNCLTPTIRELVIAFPAPEQMLFQAGQFVIFHVPTAGKSAKRAYSIGSSENRSDQIRLVFNLVPGGVASEYVRSLEIGAKLEISGPFGKLFFQEPATKQVVFLCTGAGISQHMSYLLSSAHKYPETSYRLLLGVWNEDEIFYQKELKEIAKKNPNFDFEYVLDHKLTDWSGKIGFVTQYCNDLKYMERETTFYLCGNPAMIKDMKSILSDAGFPRKRPGK